MTEPATPLGTHVTGPETSLQPPVRNAQLAFRSEGSGYRAGFLTHDAVVTDGAIRFTPRHWDGAQTVSGAPITLATASIMRGPSDLGNDLRATEMADGTVSLARVAATERIDNQAEGIEQSWRFAALPDGDGDLAVRIAVSGFRDVTTTKSGIHFHTPNQLGISYSHAVWRDSSGLAVDLPTRWTGEQLVVAVPEHILLASTFPAVLDPTITSEAAIDTLATGNTGEFARELSVAFSGTNYLVVWRDDRNGLASDIFGARVSAAGAVLDQFGIVINTANTGTQSQPTVAWVGNKWVVAWDNAGDIAAATVTAGGVVAQLGNIVATAAVETNPEIAARGTEAVVAFQSDSDIRGARFSGTTFGAAFAIAATAAVEAAPTIAANPAGEYLVAWTEGAATNDIRAQRLTSAGAASGAVITVTAAPGVQSEPAATFTGTDFLVTWTDRNDLFGGRVSTAGVVLDTHLEGATTFGGVAVSTAAGAQVTSTVRCDAASCLVVWADRRAINTNGFDLFGQRVSFAMALQGTEISVSTAQRGQIQPALAGTPSGFLAGWEDQRTGGASHAIATRISTAGVVQDATGILLNLSRNGEVEPAVATGPTSGLAVWSDSRAFGNDIMGIRYNASGNPIDSAARTVSDGAGRQATPSATFDGTQFLVVWSDNRNPIDDDIFAARFDSGTGAPIEAAGIAISTATNRQLVPDVASGGGVSLIVWQDRRNGAASGFDIFGALVTPTGTIQLNDIAISTAANDQNRPAVTFDPVNGVFVVVWSDLRGANADIFGTRVSTAGVVLDPAGVQISAGANGQLGPDIAVSSGQLLVVWDDRRNETIGDIFGARITAAGNLAVLDAAGLPIATTGGQAEPTVVGTLNGKWAVAWTDSRNSATTLTDIIGADIAPAGTVISEYTISNGVTDEHAPRYQNDPNATSKVAIVYQRLRTDINVQRVFRRQLTFQGEDGNTCKKDTECLSGFCVDGFCCDTACGGTQTKYPLDCQACSVARGAAANGTCGIVPAGRVCRGYAGGNQDLQCDLIETCDGVLTTCPDDLGRNETLACTGICGTGVCPANSTAGAPHFCDCP